MKNPDIGVNHERWSTQKPSDATRLEKGRRIRGQQNFARDQMRDAVEAAVEKDWRKDVSRALVSSIREVLGGTTLFSEYTLRSIEDLRQTVSGSAMGNEWENFMASLGSDSFVAKWIDEVRS